MSLREVLRHRIGCGEEESVKILEACYKGKNSVNMKKVKLNVEFTSLSAGRLIASYRTAKAVSDTASKQLGALDFLDATPLKSCNQGGRKIVMIAEFGLAQDVVPWFQLYTKQDGQRLMDLEDQFINQPTEENIQVLKEAIIFITPKQDRLPCDNLAVRLAGRRRSDRFDSVNSFNFTYVQHSKDCFCMNHLDGDERC